ncbi:DUF2304 domain-containing protein [Candidatus Pacearchaeota archaeon]|nr:DUF2304 domain-containing protein [Candidatus Pacearchaeota archaeon]
MIAGFEVLAVVFLVIMIYITFTSYKTKRLSKLSALFWFLVWAAGIFGIFLNKKLGLFLESLSIMRVFDLYTIIGFMFFLFIVFYLFRVVKENEKRIEEMVRVLAIKNMQKGE